jgi:hypothetical protein
MRSLIFFSNLPNPSSHTVALGFTHPQTAMSARNPVDKGRTGRKADNPTAIFEPIV